MASRWTVAVFGTVVAAGCPADAPELPDPSPTTLGDPTSSTGDEGDPTSATSTSSGEDTGPGTSTGAATDSGDTTGGIEPLDTCVGLPATCDSPATPMMGACDPWTQDCPMGLKCVPLAVFGGPDDTLCVDVWDPPGQIGEDCLSDHGGGPIDTCDVGLVCAGGTPTTNPTCVPLCGCGPDSPTCPAAATLCDVDDHPQWGLCHAVCNPLLDDCNVGMGNLGGLGCFPTDASGGFTCRPSLDLGAQPGDPCALHHDCAPGQVCLSGSVGCNDGGSCCAATCDVADPAGCAPGESCVPWYGTEPPAGCEPDIGVCTPGT